MRKLQLPEGYGGVGLLAIALLMLNLLLQDSFVRLDMTAEKRFTLAGVTKDVLDSLQSPAEIEVFFVGDYPPTVQRLQQATETHLAELQARARKNIRITHTNPAEAPAARAAFDSLGLYPAEVVVRTNELEESRKVYYPILRVSYQGRSRYVDLLEGTSARGGDLDQLRQAEAQIEYKLTRALREVVARRQPIVGLYTAPGSYTPKAMPYFVRALQPHYQVATLDLRRGPVLVPPGYRDEKLEGALPVDVLVVAQPDSAFSEREKYTLDQYLMRGGSILWVMDQLRVSEVDLNEAGRTLTELRRLNLDDFFFKQGIKLNYDLLFDLNCGYIDAVTEVNGRPQLQPQRWVYFPVIQAFRPHPITQHLGAVILRFASTLDTLPNPDLKKTVLFTSSAYSKSMKGPLVVDFNELIRYRPTPLEMQQFAASGLHVLAVLVEGNFQSLFTSRRPPVDSLAYTAPAGEFRPQSQGRGREIIFSDGSLVLGNHSRQGDPGLVLDNGTLLLNSLDYLLGEEAMLQIRTREVAFRTLDRTRVLGREGLIRAINLVLPLVLVLALGLLRWQLRRQRYRRK